MRSAASVLVVLFLVFAVAGAAFAAEMSGEVKAVDTAKGVLKLSSGTMEVPFDCETGSIIMHVKVGDKVTVEYTEKGGKKIATKVTPMAAKPKASVGC
jgi:hypothetical protein